MVRLKTVRDSYYKSKLEGVEGMVSASGPAHPTLEVRETCAVGKWAKSSSRGLLFSFDGRIAKVKVTVGKMRTKWRSMRAFLMS